MPTRRRAGVDGAGQWLSRSCQQQQVATRKAGAGGRVPRWVLVPLCVLWIGTYLERMERMEWDGQKRR